MSASQLLRIARPTESSATGYRDWLEQQDLRIFLENERSATSVTLYGSSYDQGGSVFVHSLLVPDEDVNSRNFKRWPSWEGNPFDSPSCGLVYGAGGARVEYNEPWSHSRQPLLRRARRLVFGRSFEGSHDGEHYFELAQELTHAHGLHWVDERNAWCRLDDAGDLAEFAKVERIGKGGGRGSAIAVSLDRNLLNLHMAATKTCLVQMFDSTVLPGAFNGFTGGEEKLFTNRMNGLVMKYRLDDHGASYFRGVQVICPPLNSRELGKVLYEADRAPKEYSSFITQDFKNGRIVEVSCSPDAMASYFDRGSPLPFQTSPVFFRPDVLDKYKADPDKYRLEARSISCRNAWSLQTYDFNEAGQVHTMLKYLGDLPFSEQLYWKSFNENPKGSISKRSYKTDFEGSFDSEPDGLRDLKAVLLLLSQDRTDWFALHDPKLIDQLHYPLTTSNKIWNDTLITLAKCATEGFRKPFFEREAKRLGCAGGATWGSLKWARELLHCLSVAEDRISEIMDPLFEVQRLRTKLGAHAGGVEAATIRRELLKEFQTPRAHIEALATKLSESLNALSSVCKSLPRISSA